jgi:hypothetical protein
MRTISKNSAHRTTSIQRLNDERNEMAHVGDEMWRKSEATKLEAAEGEVLLYVISLSASSTSRPDVTFVNISFLIASHPLFE